MSALNLKQFDQLEIPVVSTPGEPAETPASPDVSHEEQQTLVLDSIAEARSAESKPSITGLAKGGGRNRILGMAAAALVGILAVGWAALSLFTSGSYAPQVETYPRGAEVWIDARSSERGPWGFPRSIAVNTMYGS